MCANLVALGYIDPNTSQYVFNLLGPILACLTATGGLAITAVIFIRHRITSCFRNASWTRRVFVVCLGIGASAIVAFVIWRILW